MSTTTERERAWNIADVRHVLETRTAREINTREGKILLDLFSASVIVPVFDALKESNQAHAQTLPLAKFADWAMRVTGGK